MLFVLYTLFGGIAAMRLQMYLQEFLILRKYYGNIFPTCKSVFQLTPTYEPEEEAQPYIPVKFIVPLKVHNSVDSL